MKSESYKCTCVVTTHNRVHDLKDCLLSLAEQSIGFDDYQILLIDNYSSDKNLVHNLYVEFKNKYPLLNIDYHYEDIVGGMTYSRNRAVKIADSEIVVFCDDDYIAEKNLLRSVIESFDDDDVAIVTGPLIPLYETKPPKWVKKLWRKTKYGFHLTDFSLCDFGPKIQEIPYNFAFWPNYAVRKSFFINGNGFAPDGFSGDYLRYNGSGELFFSRYAKLQGRKIIYNPNMLAHHKVSNYRFSKEYFDSRYFFYGLGISFDLTRNEGKLLGFFKKYRIILSYSYNLISDIFKSSWILKFRYFALIKGYLYHQRELKRDPSFLNYVLTDNWLNFDFSTLKPKKHRAKFTIWPEKTN